MLYYVILYFIYILYIYIIYYVILYIYYVYIIYIMYIYIYIDIDIDIDIQNLVNLLSLPAPSRFQGSLILTGGSLKIQGHEEKVTVTTVKSWNEDSMLRSSKKQVEVLAALA